MAQKIALSKEAIIEMAHRLAGTLAIASRSIQSLIVFLLDDLLSKKRFDEAARIFLDHAENPRQCINAHVQGNLFSEARRIVNFSSVLSTSRILTQNLDSTASRVRAPRGNCVPRPI